MTFIAFPGHAGRGWTLLGWRLVTRSPATRTAPPHTAFPGHAGRGWTLLGWRLVTHSPATRTTPPHTAFPGHPGRGWTLLGRRLVTHSLATRMRDLLDEIDRWRSAGKRIALARVVDVEGSGPRSPGAAMVVSEDGDVAGSVSGGCVEGAVVSEALAVLAGEADARVVTFGYSDDEAFAVGLTCGGTIRLFVEELDW